MSEDFKFIKLQPSNGVIYDKEGNTIASVLIFRPDVAVKDRLWFEKLGTDGKPRCLCLEIGPDKIPVNLKLAYINSDGPKEGNPIPNEEIVECFEWCYRWLLSIKNTDDELQRLGDEIIGDMLSGGTI